MEIITGGVTAAEGFEAASTAAGIKYQDRTDMALVYSKAPCVAAGTFTTNVVKAAPVQWDRQVIDGKGKVQAVVVNSGIANACTGKEGLGYCEETARAAGEALEANASAAEGYEKLMTVSDQYDSEEYSNAAEPISADMAAMPDSERNRSASLISNADTYSAPQSLILWMSDSLP